MLEKSFKYNDLMYGKKPSASHKIRMRGTSLIKDIIVKGGLSILLIALWLSMPVVMSQITEHSNEPVTEQVVDEETGATTEIEIYDTSSSNSPSSLEQFLMMVIGFMVVAIIVAMLLSIAAKIMRGAYY